MIKIKNKEIKATVFPDGTRQVWNIDIPEERTITIVWNYNVDEVFDIFQLVDLLVHEKKKVILKTDFLPFGRQDHKVDNKNTFALHTFGKILNSLGLAAIETIDAHSGVITKYLPLIDVLGANRILEVLKETNSDYICFPDEGAKIRYSKIPELKDFKKITFSKTRNQSDLEVKLDNDFVNLENKKVLIIDDICDGGRTFIEVSKKLNKYKAKEVNLYTSHGIYSKGLDVLREAKIKRIFNYRGEEL